MIYTHTQITVKLTLKWLLFLIPVNIFFAFFFWSLNKEIPIFTNFLYGLITSSTILTFAGLSQIFLKTAKPYFRLLIVFVSCIMGTLAGLTMISTYMIKMPYDLFMFLFILNLLIVSIITGFLYYWEGIAVTNSKLQEERIKILDMEKKIVQTRLQLVQAPIEPNFLFSTLKQVLTILDSDIAKAKNLQLSLIQYLRLSLSKLKKKTHAVRQEAEMIRAYLDILKKHPDRQLGYEINLPDIIHDLHIPPMLLFVVIEMIVDYVEASNCRKSILTFMGEDMPDGTRFELMVSGLHNIGENDILLAFQDIRERFNKSFGNMASLLLKLNLPDNFNVIIKLRP